MKIDKAFYPGFARKAVSFSIDDGNAEADARFISIVKPRGISGTFNLISSSLHSLSPEEYRSLYSGYEVANHCKYHPVTIDPNDAREFSDRVFNSDEADERYFYRHPEIDGLWYLKRHDFWCVGAKYGDYIRFADEGRSELETLFGEKSVSGFVWPHGCCYDERISEHLRSEGYAYTRYTHHVDGLFALQRDRFKLGMHARSTNLEEAGDAFLTEPDTGELKMLLFGVHSHDYEVLNRWDALAAFCDKFRERPSEFWSATNSEIFEYIDASNSMTVTNGEIINPSSVRLYVSVDGEKISVEPNSIYKL